tara:strand:- start:969 stop:1199 length:231 start_codon:yes stop_codon:yes gene_type:complete
VVTGFDVALSLLKKPEAVLDYAFLPEPLAKLLGKIVVAREFAVIEERGAGKGIPSCLCDTLIDGAGGVTYLEAKIK